MFSTILILHALAAGNFWPAQIELGFKQELEKSGYKGSFDSLYLPSLDTKSILDKIDEKKPSCIVISNDPMNDELIRAITKIRKIPVFFASIPKQESQLSWLTDNRNYVTGVLERTHLPDVVTTLEKIKSSNIKKMGILVGGPSENMWSLGELIQFEMKQRPDIQIDLQWAKTYEIWKEKAVTLNRENDVLVPLLPYGMTSLNENVETDWDLINQFMIQNITIPTIGIGCMHTKIKRTIALSMKPRAIGVQVAKMVYDHIHNGVKVSNINIETTKFYELEIDSENIKRLKLKIPDEIASYANIL
jgi:ABC-type uncharacterized transport system substrate-binding protein